MKKISLVVFISWIALSSCLRRVYLQSPFQATDHAYRAIPMVSDGKKSNVYASGSLVAGFANQNLRDGVFQFQGSIHRSHTLPNFQFFMASQGCWATIISQAAIITIQVRVRFSRDLPETVSPLVSGLLEGLVL